MITLENITVQVGDATLLESVTMEVRPRHVTAILGANGAGKSTLLRTACGELVPTNGQVRMDGQPLNALPAREQARRRAVLPQAATLRFSFSVIEVVLMGRMPHRRTEAAARDWAIAHAALEAVSMTNFAERSYPTLSGGEKQRVQLARTLAQVWEPPSLSISTEAGSGHRYLLLDEPTANLDLAHQHGVLEVARSFAAEGVGVLAVLHDLNLAAQYADHLVVLCQGRVVAQGSPKDVLTPVCIQDAFGLPVLIQPHPCHDCPLVVPFPTGRQTADGGFVSEEKGEWERGRSFA